MGLSESFSAKRIEETPEQVKGTVNDNGSASGWTFLQTEYWPSCAL